MLRNPPPSFYFIPNGVVTPCNLIFFRFSIHLLKKVDWNLQLIFNQWTYSLYYCMGKSNCDVTILTGESTENLMHLIQIFSWISEFALVTQCNFSRTQIKVNKKIIKKIALCDRTFINKHKAFICWFAFYPPPTPHYTPGKPSSVYAGPCGFSLSSASKPSSSCLSSELFLQNPGILS